MKERIYNGRILRAISGFYWVKTDSDVIRCKPRGVFRKDKISPVVGDLVKCSVEGSSGTILEINARKNYFVRPPLANLDQLFFVVSACSPFPNFFIIDQLIAIAEHQRITPILVVTKGDIAPYDFIANYYKKAGYKVFCTNEMDENVVKAFLKLLNGKTSAVCGNTGVGKSTFLNTLFPFLSLDAGETSEKLGRGRHTTRIVELFEVGGGYFADTPGFSTVVMDRYGNIPKEKLQECFLEFNPYIGKCRFNGCSHRAEPGCAVTEAVKEGVISEERYKSYVKLYNMANQNKSWK